MHQPQLIGPIHESSSLFRRHPDALRVQQDPADTVVADDGADVHANVGFNNGITKYTCTECAAGQLGGRVRAGSRHGGDTGDGDQSRCASRSNQQWHVARAGNQQDAAARPKQRPLGTAVTCQASQQAITFHLIRKCVVARSCNRGRWGGIWLKGWSPMPGTVAPHAAWGAPKRQGQHRPLTPANAAAPTIQRLFLFTVLSRDDGVDPQA
jgi:hypothetical protein